MSEARALLLRLAWRALVAAPFFYLCASGRASVLSPVFGVVGAIIVALPLARLIAEPAGRLFWPEERFDRPQPMYGIPESLRAKGRYEEALAGFEQIAADYPGEVKPHVAMIDIAIVDLKDADRAQAIFQRGVEGLKKQEDKETLARMYSAIRTRLPAGGGPDEGARPAPS